MPKESYRVGMSASEAHSFTLMHPEAAEALFTMAAGAQHEHRNTGLRNMMRKALDGGYRQSVRDARAVNAIAEAVQPNKKAREKAVAVQNKLASKQINLKPQQMFGVRMDAAHWNTFASQHTAAARDLFKTAERHLGPEAKGATHRINMWFDKDYRDNVQDARAVRAMASSLGRFHKAETPRKAAVPAPDIPTVTQQQQGQDIIETTVTTRSLADQSANGHNTPRDWYSPARMAGLQAKAKAKGMSL
jgi:hypothetical protein